MARDRIPQSKFIYKIAAGHVIFFIDAVNCGQQDSLTRQICNCTIFFEYTGKIFSSNLWHFAAIGQCRPIDIFKRNNLPAEQ
jgi:hypothetical protein